MTTTDNKKFSPLRSCAKGDKMTKEEYLTTRLEEQINWYNKKSIINQEWYKALKIIDCTLALLIVPFSYYIDRCQWFQYAVIIAGMAISLSNFLQSIYKYHENWIQYRATAELLKHEKYLFLTQSGGYSVACDPFRELVERCESIISSENIDWAQLHKNEPCKKT